MIIAVAVKNMIADYGNTGAYPGKMAGRTCCQDTTAGRTTEALQKKTGRKTAKVARRITMPPQAVMTAPGARGWALPRKIFAERKNILEYSRNEMYHEYQRLRVVTPPGNKGG